MPALNYTITEVSLDLELVTVEVTLEDGSLAEASVSIRQIATSEGDSAEQLGAALDQVVAQYIYSAFPPPCPRPAALEEMVNSVRVAQV